MPSGDPEISISGNVILDESDCCLSGDWVAGGEQLLSFDLS